MGIQAEEEKSNAETLTLSLNAELAEKKHASEAMGEQTRALHERVAESAARIEESETRFEESEGIEKGLRAEIRSLTVQVETGWNAKEMEAKGRAAAEAAVETLKGKAAKDEERMEDLVRCVEAKTGDVDAMGLEMEGWREKAGEYKSAMEGCREEAEGAVRGEVEKLKGDVVAAGERGRR